MLIPSPAGSTEAGSVVCGAASRTPSFCAASVVTGLEGFLRRLTGTHATGAFALNVLAL